MKIKYNKFEQTLMRKIVKSIYILFILISTDLFSQEYTIEETKAAYIYSFAKYVTWQNEKNIKQYIIGIVGTKDEFDKFKNVLKGQKLKNGYLVIVPVFNIDSIPRIHLLYINNANCANLDKIKKSLSKNVLLVSDNCKLSDNIMINFLDVNSNNKFELNIKNILFADLEISRKIVLIGGGEDASWQDLFIKAENQLAETKQILNNQIIEIQKQQETLDKKANELENKELEIILKNNEIALKRTEIEKQNQILENQNLKISEQSSNLNDLLSKMKFQELIMFLIIIFLVLGVFLVIFIYKAYKTKKNANRQLEIRNQTINIQKDEIEEKSKKLESYNIELQHQKEEISKQADQLIVAFNQLKDLEDFKKDMIGMIVHDLKNPLNTIISYSSTIPHPDNMITIHQSGKQMLNLVMNILDVQKFEDAKIKLSCSEFSVQDIINESIGNVSLLLKEKNINLRFEPEIDFKALIDMEMIQRVIVNLLTNAIKYTPVNGSIIISIVSVEFDSKEYIQFSISDTGVGIPLNMQDRVFEKFTQAEAKKSGITRSTGIGLTFCKMAIESHSGRIWLTSKVKDDVNDNFSSGTTFYFTLPASDSSQYSETHENEIFINQQEQKLAILSDNEKNIMLKFKKDFVAITIFDTGRIMSILSNMKEQTQNSGFENLKFWIQKMEDASYNFNEILFNQLIDQISDT